jgi:hypothetical protein
MAAEVTNTHTGRYQIPFLLPSTLLLVLVFTEKVVGRDIDQHWYLFVLFSFDVTLKVHKTTGGKNVSVMYALKDYIWKPPRFEYWVPTRRLHGESGTRIQKANPHEKH